MRHSGTNIHKVMPSIDKSNSDMVATRSSSPNHPNINGFNLTIESTIV
jgi:hypothetical protein